MSAPNPPPLPRPGDQVTFSELVPFRSSKIRLWRSPLVWLVAFTVVVTVILFAYRVKILDSTDPQAKLDAFVVVAQVTIFYIFALSLLGVHAYSKTDKPIYYYVLPALFIFWFMRYSGLWYYWFQPFQMLAGGPTTARSPDLLPRIWAAFAGPGMREELLKALPTLFGAALTVWAARFTALPARLTELLRIRSPLDGMLMGFACGAAFIFVETGGQYLTNAFVSYYKQTQNADGAIGSALLLIIPRTMRGWIGHMGYAGIFGYFIGLAVLRRSLAPRLIIGGYLVASLLHGLWDAGLPGDDVPMYAVGAAVGLLNMGCFLKARQLDAALFGRGTATSGSIIVPAAFTPLPAMAARPASPAPAAPLAPTALALAFPAACLPIAPGDTFDFARTALGDAARGVHAQVTQHPTNPGVLGLKNTGTLPWYAHLRDGTVQSIDPGRSVRLALGVSIDFGRGLLAQVATHVVTP